MACETRTSGRFFARMASIFGSGSVACTSWPRATSCWVSLPVPAPSSRTLNGWSEVSQIGGLARVGGPASVVGVRDPAEGAGRLGLARRVVDAHHFPKYRLDSVRGREPFRRPPGLVGDVGGRAVGVRGGARRHRRGAPRPGAASYVAGDDRRVAAPGRPRLGRAGGLRVVAGGGAVRLGRSDRRRRGAGLDRAARAGADADPISRCRSWRGCTRWPPPGRSTTPSSGGRGTPERPSGCRGWRGC